MIYKMTLKDSVDTMTFNLLETPIVDKDIEGAVDNVTLDGNQYTDYLYLKKQYIQKWAIMCPDEYDELRGFYTRQFEEGEVPSYRVYYGANVTRDYTFNGDYFQFNAEGIETGMTLSQLTGNTEQTTYSGKNLLNDTTAQRTIPSSGSFNATIPMTVGAGTYSFGAFADGAFCPEANYYVFQFRNGSTPIVQSSTPPTPMTLTAQEASQVDNMFLYFNANFTGRYGGKHLTAMVCSGSTLGDYEPYTGSTSSQITPSPNPDYPQSISTVTGAQTVVVTGKNLLDTSDPHDKSGSGMTATWNNGVVEVKGTNTATSFPLSDNIALPTQIKAGTEISASFVGASVGNTVFRFFNQATSQYEALAVANPNTSGTYTLTRDADAVQLYKGGVPTNTYKEFSISNWQIEYGSTATAYEPYQSQSYEVNLGKNLIKTDDLSTRVSGGLTTTWANNVGDTTGTATGTSALITDSVTTGVSLPAGTYTFSVQTATTQNMSMNFYNADTSAWETVGTIPAGSLKYTFTTTFKATGWRIGYAGLTANTSYTLKCDRPMIEAGTQATSYAPYFTPIELAKVGNYQDRIYKDDGKWYIEENVGKVVLDGTENWALAATYTNCARFVDNDFVVPSTTSPLLCDYFTQGVGGTDTPNIAIHGQQRTVMLTISKTIASTVDAFKAWLASTNPSVYYALATPTTTEITDDTLLYQLNFLASLYKGENNISLVGTGAQGEMEVFIRDVMSVETDVVPEVPVRLTLTDDGVINACGCRRNVQLTMRETTE